MEEILSRSTAAENFNALVLTIFGCSALVLAAIGIYGLMAYSVTHRADCGTATFKDAEARIAHAEKMAAKP
jgi:hypothetical protein